MYQYTIVQLHTNTWGIQVQDETTTQILELKFMTYTTGP